jgi:hypothetical protein
MVRGDFPRRFPHVGGRRSSHVGVRRERTVAAIAVTNEE